MATTNRYRTRVVVVVHSHVTKDPKPNDYIDLSADVVELETNKTIKGVGSFSLTLVPRKNYLNVIFPNDVINIYIDPGDGKTGLTRTMFGFIDRIERTENVDRNTGAITTMFRVTGSDFAKAIEKTNVYFNPDLGLRPDVATTFGSLNLGGNMLRTKGVRIHGTPADIVEDLLELMFGFGAQWILPKSYPDNYVLASRSQRVQRTVKRFPTELKERLKSMGYAEGVSSAQLLNDISAFLQGKNSKFSDLNFRSTDAADSLKEADASRIALQEQLSNNSSFLAYQSALKKTGDVPVTLLDLLDTSFIESMAIDGYIQAESIWQSKGSLLSIMHANSNELVNELCFDLRPVAVGGDDNMTGKEALGYSRTPDEIQINTNGTNTIPAQGVAGVRYVPAVVMREYPHSVAEGLDLSSHVILGTDKVGFIAMGPVFAKGAGEGENKRYYFDYSDELNTTVAFKALTPIPCDFQNDAKPVKHIDVVAIRDADVFGSSLGRSDQDTYNLITLYSSNPLMQSYRYLLVEFVPTLTQVSIERHGLRVLDAQTKFASTTADPECHITGTPIDNVAVRKNIIRWSLLLDHWNQHNIEYLSGTIQLRGMPELRVGYRLDWIGRSESYYVESVSHTWKYPGEMITSVQVSRGQRNDPFPIYVPPAIAAVDKAKIQQTLPQEGDNTFLDGGDDGDVAAESTSSIPGIVPPVPKSDFRFLNTSATSTSAFITNQNVRTNADGTKRGHFGNDYRLKDGVGTPIYAIAPGTVVAVGYQLGSDVITAGVNNAVAQLPVNKYNSGAGGLIIKIKHVIDGNTYYSRYMHLDSFIGTNAAGNASHETAIGDVVVAGQQIATGGDSGFTKDKPGTKVRMTPHLHFEIRNASQNPIDPAPFFGDLLKKSGKAIAAPKAKTTAKVAKDIAPSGTQIGGGDRSSKGRLAEFFKVKDTQATLRARDTKPNGDQENTVDKSSYPKDYENAWPKHAKASATLAGDSLENKNNNNGGAVS